MNDILTVLFTTTRRMTISHFVRLRRSLCPGFEVFFFLTPDRKNVDTGVTGRDPDGILFVIHE